MSTVRDHTQLHSEVDKVSYRDALVKVKSQTGVLHHTPAGAAGAATSDVNAGGCSPTRATYASTRSTVAWRGASSSR